MAYPLFQKIKTLCIFLFMPLGLWAEEQNVNWYHNFMFQDKTFEYEFIRTLGYSTTGAADIGEAIATARAIKDGDIYSWRDEWLKTAERMQALANRMENEGQEVSAREAYFRASNYFRTAGFFLNAPKDRAEGIDIWQKSVDSFRKGARFFPALTQVAIPYEGTTLPGYLLKSDIKDAPLLLVHTGFDGTKEELFFAVGTAALTRGYNVLMFEGPGQGEVIKKQNIPFRYDWEKVVTPVVDYAMKLDFIDKKKISLMGISLGGYLAARAAAFEHRLEACVLNGGIFDFFATVMQTMPPNERELLVQDPEKFNTILYEVLTKNPQASWFFNNGMWTFQSKTPSEFLNKLKPFTVQAIAQNIRCRTLVIDSAADLLFKGQPELVMDTLTCPKTLLVFTKETAAQAHCQMGSIAISNEEIFSWLSRNTVQH